MGDSGALPQTLLKGGAPLSIRRKDTLCVPEESTAKQMERIISAMPMS